MDLGSTGQNYKFEHGSSNNQYFLSTGMKNRVPDLCRGNFRLVFQLNA